MYRYYFKRPIDIVVSLVLLIVTLPISILVIVLIKLESKGPSIFKQARTGLRGSTFMMYKFRTMAVDNDVRDKSSANKYTRVGKIIRATSLDEIPQFINVIKGDMSLVGPRPWIPEYYTFMNKLQRIRVRVRPGITGLAQVKGRNKITILQKIQYDLDYVENLSFIMDSKIIILTFIESIKRTGIEIEKIAIHKEIEFLKNQKIEPVLQGPTLPVSDFRRRTVFYTEKPDLKNESSKKVAK